MREGSPAIMLAGMAGSNLGIWCVGSMALLLLLLLPHDVCLLDQTQSYHAMSHLLILL